MVSIEPCIFDPSALVDSLCVQGNLNLHKCELRVGAFNISAVRVYEKVGFVHEGRSRESFFREGKWEDVRTTRTMHIQSRQTC